MRFLGSCCCGCSLKVGTLIIGYLSLVAMVLDILEKGVSTGNGFWGIIRLVIDVLQIIAVIVMLYGAHTEKPKLLWPYIIMTLITVIVYLITGIGLGVHIIGNDLVAGLSQIVICILFALLGIYCIWVVYSYQAELLGKNVGGVGTV